MLEKAEHQLNFKTVISFSVKIIRQIHNSIFAL